MSKETPSDHLAAEISSVSRAVGIRRERAFDWILGEFAGTFLLVFFGCGAVAASVLVGAHSGVVQVALVWGLGIATAIYLTGSLSGAHLNPAVTLAMAVCSDFPRARVIPYIAVQLVAAIVASAVLYAIFSNAFVAFEESVGVVRGQPGSEASAMVFGEFFPNPGGRPLDPDKPALASHGSAFFAEVVGTAILVLVIFCVTDPRNSTRPQMLTPLTIGLTVTILISIMGPLSMLGMNPARDLGPRIFSSFAGWGLWPFQANGWGWLTVYVLAPFLGGLIGGAIYRLFFRTGYALTHAPGQEDR